MNCLCCGKILKTGDDTGWHKSCIRRFFSTTTIPEIEIEEKILEQLATESIQKGYTVPGVQKKLSLHLFSGEKKPRLTLVNYPTGYILKPQVEQFEALPEAEQLVMTMADMVGISTVPHALLKGKEAYAYITKRVDRQFDGDNVKMLAMEDFCQLDLRLTQDKYKGSYERCAKIIQRYSSRKGLDMTELYLRLLFSFVVGNSDMHLKNFSLIETSEASGEYILSAAYDMLSTNVVIPDDKEQMALTINGKKQNIRRKDFINYAEAIDIDGKVAEKIIKKIVNLKDKYITMCRESYIPNSMKTSLEKLIEERIFILTI